MIELIDLCEWGILALFFLFLWDLTMESIYDNKSLRYIGKNQLRKSRVRVLQVIAKANSIPISKHGVNLTRAELLTALLLEKDRLNKLAEWYTLLNFNLAQPLLPSRSILPKVQDLFNKSLACQLFNYSLTDIITIKDLRQRLKPIMISTDNNRLLSLAYKSIKDNILWLEDRKYTHNNLILYGKDSNLYTSKGVSIDNDLTDNFKQDDQNLEVIHSLGLEEVVNSEDLIEMQERRAEEALNRLKKITTNAIKCEVERSIRQEEIDELSRQREELKKALLTLQNK